MIAGQVIMMLSGMTDESGGNEGRNGGGVGGVTRSVAVSGRDGDRTRPRDGGGGSRDVILANVSTDFCASQSARAQGRV